MLSTIPFEGFYGTKHEDAFDREIEMLCDTEGWGEANSDLLNYLYVKASFCEAFKLYAEAYAKKLCELFKFEAEFESLRSPREYNFTTDKIYVRIELDEVKRLKRETPESVFLKTCKEALEPCPGFIPFYSYDPSNWPPIEKWDHNQVGLLVQAYIEHKGEVEDISTEHMMDFAQENGDISNWLFSSNSEALNRVDNIARYLRNRKER